MQWLCNKKTLLVSLQVVWDTAWRFQVLGLNLSAVGFFIWVGWGESEWFLPPSFHVFSFFFFNGCSPPRPPPQPQGQFGACLWCFYPILPLPLCWLQPLFPLLPPFWCNCLCHFFRWRQEWGPVWCSLFHMWCPPFIFLCRVSSSTTLSSLLNLSFGGFSYLSTFLFTSHLPLMAWAWVLQVDPLSAFHLGLVQPNLYLQIHFILWREVTTFHLPLNHFTQNLFNITVWHLFLFFSFNGVLSSPLKAAWPSTKN